MSNTDFFKELAEEAGAEDTSDILVQAQVLASEVSSLDVKIEFVEAELSKLKSRRWEILTKELVELLDQARVDAVVVDGRTFAAEMYYKASIPEENRKEAHDWLEAHDAGDLIKRTLVVEFPKDAEEESARLRDYIRTHFQMAEVDEKRLVPWARLTSWLKGEHETYSREMAEHGTSKVVMPPLDIMGATISRIVKIKDKRR